MISKNSLLVFLALISTVYAVDCVAYCNAINSGCTNYLAAGYQDNATCVEACSLMPLGTTGDTSGNSASCRLHYATLSTPNCAAASVSGGGVCGSYCETLCFFLQESCVREYLDATTGVWDNVACIDVCGGGLKQNGADFPLDKTGDNVQCRIYHAAASWVNTTVHCPHASLAGATHCGTPLTAYCYLMNFTCPTTYGSYSSCMTQAAAISQTGIDVQYGLTYGDNLGCRVHQASLAATDPTKCAQAGLTSTICNANYVPPTSENPTYDFNGVSPLAIALTTILALIALSIF